MATSSRDLKVLWGRCGNLCAKCRRNVTDDKEHVDQHYVLGEMAHIVGKEPGSARYTPSLNDDERNGYANLVVLCPTCHATVDLDCEAWPIEKLHELKSKHELFVEETLTSSGTRQQQNKQRLAAVIIDGVVNTTILEHWMVWTGGLLAPDPTFEVQKYEAVYELRRWLQRAIWSDEFDELRRSVTTLGELLFQATNHFSKHMQLIGDTYHAEKFYRARGWNDHYNEELKQYNKWISDLHSLIIAATKSANWFADVVRRDVNPYFKLENGRFQIEQGPFEDLRFTYSVPLFSDQEKQMLPDKIADFYTPN